ncbi:MAG: hypothetical protein PVF93_00890 [Chromatiaceae bacterium]|jgi:hypothetical protein
MIQIEELVTSGRIVDLMLIFILLEVVAIQLIRRYTGAGIAILPLLTNIGAGGSVMLALRAQITGAGWHWVAILLLSALVFHVIDLWQRWERPAAAASAGSDPA